ncbi:MAG: Very short patch repair protein [Smithella sp. PtaU1.Bin162]|nr:MAG: Very short patch repair protein [Smithella sp. PtaU1.Bin162]
MQNIRSEGTRPELSIAKELRRRKIYFAKNVKTIIGKPDFVFRRKWVAVFVDSDFWHGHRTRCIMPKSNCGYWEEKIARNKQRDRQVTRTLKKDGWTVIRLWEKDIRRNLEKSIKKITGVL